MKKIFLLGAAALGLLVLSSYSQNSLPTISEYRKTYTALAQKWEKETNAVTRFELRQEIEQLKKDNLSLFVKK